MNDQQGTSPDSTAVRVALWRALHVLIDPPPHVFVDEIGLKLAAPEDGWRHRPDMHPHGTARFRASILARARFVEDMVDELVGHGVGQYVILGAGLDTFAQRRPELNSKLRLFEVDRPETQAWKQRRLRELGLGMPEWPSFVPVNFEAKASLWEQLAKAGFDKKRSALISSLGVSMYLTKTAVENTLREMAALAPGSKFVMTFMMPLELVDPEDQPGYQMAERGARASGTPFLSFFSPQEMEALARAAGFRGTEHLSTASLTPRYFSGRTDNLRPSSGEELLIAST